MLAANGVEAMIAEGREYTPTPAISHAILTYNRGRTSGLADGIVITPSHNPPEDGGFKYNPPHGGPADTDVTGWIEKRANELLAERPGRRQARSRFERALAARPRTATTIVDAVRRRSCAASSTWTRSRARRSSIGVDPLGGAGVAYWQPIAERYRPRPDLVNDAVDPTFGFMTVDWDGKIRMDCSSPYAMAGLIALKDQFDVAFANDTDHDRHGIVTRARA